MIRMNESSNTSSGKGGAGKVEEPHYIVRIYNSGESINDYHLSIRDGVKTKYLPYVEQTDIPQHRLINPIFVQMLHELADPLSSGVAKRANTRAEDIYEKLMFSLGGKRSNTKFS